MTSADAAPRPSLSVCVIACDEEETIGHCLRSADFADECVVVVDAKSRDAAGVAPLAPWLERIDAAKDARDLQDVWAYLATCNVDSPFGIGSVPDFIENHKSGKLRVVAVLGGKRQAVLPDVPTFSELGLKGLEDLPYYGVFAPAGTPPAALEQFSQALAKVIAQPDVKERLTTMGLDVGFMSGKQLGEREAAYRKVWAEIIRKTGFQPQ